MITISGINELSDIRLLVYPNPANEILTIQTETKNNQKLVAELRSQDGKLMLKTPINFGEGAGIASVNLSDFANDIYYLKIGSRTMSKVIRILKQDQ